MTDWDFVDQAVLVCSELFHHHADWLFALQRAGLGIWMLVDFSLSWH